MTRKAHKPKGTYLLLAQLDHPAKIPVGKLGTLSFAAGWYAYAGSALGPGGLEARLARHARASKRLHWHVDYLLQHATLSKVWTTACSKRLECAWATAMQNLPGAQAPVPGFGASDCRCATHLIYFSQRPSDLQIVDVLSGRSPAKVRVRNIPPSTA